MTAEGSAAGAGDGPAPWEQVGKLAGHANGARAAIRAGRYLYTVDDRRVRAWDAERGFRHVRAPASGAAALFADGTYLYAARFDGRVDMFDLDGGRAPVAVLRGHSALVLDVFSDDEHVYTASDDCTVRVWDKRDGFAPVAVLKGHTERVTAVSADAQHVYSASYDRTVRVWRRGQGSTG